MQENEFSSFTDQELLEEAKKNKSTNIFSAFIIGIMIGVAIYGAVKNGPGFFTFLTLIFAFTAFSNAKKTKELNFELKSRNLK